MKDYIGVFDSGVGGLSVFEKLVKVLPSENYIYFADTKNLPYGSKSQVELVNITRKIFDFFKTKQVKAVVMACNTTSAIAYDTLKNEYGFKIYPLIQTAAKSIANLNATKIGVLATVATVNSLKYTLEIKKNNPDIEVFEHACPEWVKIVEEQTFNEPGNIEIIKKDLFELLDKNVEKIVLGCTHYPYLMNVLTQFAPKEIFIDPAQFLANIVAKDFVKTGKNDAVDTERLFFVSSNPQNFLETSPLFYKIDKLPELVK